MTCKDCIHYDVCRTLNERYDLWFPDEMWECDRKGCSIGDGFKNRAHYIKLNTKGETKTTCRDCIHFDVCRALYEEYWFDFTDESWQYEQPETKCSIGFKNRSIFVEMPSKAEAEKH